MNHWKSQRRHYQPAFSVNDELKKLMPLINARAILSIDILKKNQMYVTMIMLTFMSFK